MKFTTKDLGESRWVMFCYADTQAERYEFIRWVQAQPANIFMGKNVRYWGGEPIEVRGGNPADRTMLLLRWSKNHGQRT